MFPKGKVILSGMQPSGALHLGNWLGALKNWVNLQQDNHCFFTIVDLHAITIPYEPKELPQRVLELAADFLAAGIDPEKSVLFVQSHVPEHVELAWLFNTITPLGELERMTQFKDKASEHREAQNAGLLNYPILMAADILLYHPDLVPVGEDQTQHVEFTRTLARKFNSTFGEYFTEPKVYEAQVPRVMSLLEPAKKMSKSYGPNHCIFLSDEPETIRKKIAKAVTDDGGTADGRISGGRNLLQLFKVLSDDKALKQQLDDQYRVGELKYSEFKPLLAEAIIKTLEPIRKKRQELLSKPKQVEKTLLSGRDSARVIAAKTLSDVKERMGLA
ncbi:MAG: tryptophan--tRNA ligase [Candidatus Veblenbacteria bacterium]|nr:tryptophan--tRNA ligase [Candidatus Veblenbacteria bacterium]MDZ4229926.1 tryptophan--tRNA ligase [Candidatus Veblenbacteria bacterium]